MTRVLLLEDDDSLATAIVRALEATGYGVTRFRNLSEARHAIPPIGFRVLLCDYDLPDGTGLEFLADVENSHAFGLDGLTAILWSGLDRAAEVEASGLQVDHVLVKDSRAIGTVLGLLGAL